MVISEGLLINFTFSPIIEFILCCSNVFEPYCLWLKWFKKFTIGSADLLLDLLRVVKYWELLEAFKMGRLSKFLIEESKLWIYCSGSPTQYIIVFLCFLKSSMTPYILLLVSWNSSTKRYWIRLAVISFIFLLLKHSSASARVWSYVI